jgi:hypothetical protein
MTRLYERLFPDPRTVAGSWMPVVAVLSEPGGAGARLVGVITPSDLTAKWGLWYVGDAPVSSGVCYKDPNYCLATDKVRDAYEKMGGILTGLPVLADDESKVFVGFLPHYGTREDWAKRAPPPADESGRP